MPQTRAEAEAGRLRRKFIWFVTVVLLALGIGLMTLGPTQASDANMKQIFRALGSFITVTIVLAFLYRVTVAPYDIAKSEERIKELLYREIDRVYSAAKSYGFGGIDHSLDFQNMFNNLKKSETLWWLDTYHPAYKEWIDPAEQALKSGAHINMLVMNPESAMLEHRAAELGSNYKPDAFKQELIVFRDHLVELAKRYPDRLRIRQYGDLPCAPIYVVTSGTDPQPRRAYSSYFLSQATGIRFPHFIWHQGENPFIEELFLYLKAKWDRAKGV